jgi:hypothetical protein
MDARVTLQNKQEQKMIHFKRFGFFIACLLIAGVSYAFGQEAVKIVDLFDPTHPKGIAGQKGWGYQKTSSVDLDNDGLQEKIFLIANVSLYKGKPLWDDGQIWQVYIQTSKGQRTYVFSRFVQLGHIEVLAARLEPSGGNTILILERTPHDLRVYEVYYRGYENFRAVQLLSRAIDPRSMPTGSSKPFSPTVR